MYKTSTSIEDDDDLVEIIKYETKNETEIDTRMRQQSSNNVAAAIGGKKNSHAYRCPNFIWVLIRQELDYWWCRLIKYMIS